MTVPGFSRGQRCEFALVFNAATHVLPGFARALIVSHNPMNRYELMCLVPTKFAEDELSGVMGQVRDLITKQCGKITFEDNLGKKRLT